jgi:aspartate racemase
MKTLKKIGILGGMGPAASAELYRRMVQYCQTEYGAVQDSDYPQIFVNSLVLKGFDETGISDTSLVLKQLEEGICQLSEWVDIIAMPCNTIHYFFEELSKKTTTQMISIIDLTASKIINDHRSCVGVMCSKSTMELGIYTRVLQRHGIKALHPDISQQGDVTGIIERVMGGNQTIHDDRLLMSIAKNLMSRGAEAIVIGCTELPFAMSRMHELPSYDTIQILAEGAVDVAMKLR